jgi:rSAM/selenodomain-associated transferase 1
MVGLFAKPPRAGRVKSRLVPPLTEEEAAGLYTAFLGDLAEMLGAEGDAWRWWVYSTDPEEQETLWPAAAPRPTGWRRQVGVDLGERMHEALSELLAERAEAAVLIGSDHPTLSPAFLEEAFDLLANADVVLGPSLDGGYYLVGTNRPQPSLFEGVAWSTPSVLQQTLERIRGAGLRAAFLPPWYDVDTAADLHFLRTHLLAVELGASLPPCPRTRSWLAHHPVGPVPREEEKP